MPIITLQDNATGEMIRIRSVKDPKVLYSDDGQVVITQETKWLYLEDEDLLPDKLQEQLKAPRLNQVIDGRYLIYKIDNQP
ncbi:hypothetical protein [Acinetobacter courvalinii]|uniref:Uncharacterized protein n=1 Tax=Acinetobacter courvalinii TaxID=280147 RepID=A0AA42IB15_9GAMM|nr:hypothetical protein [Acinetobacter courvalinii]MDH0562918.1 hypothetical protein [Acinetobacter courvalinii]